MVWNQLQLDDRVGPGHCDYRTGLGVTPLQHLPLHARAAIELLDADNCLCTEAMLDTLLQGYAKSCHAETADLETCAAARRTASAPSAFGTTSPTRSHPPTAAPV